MAEHTFPSYSESCSDCCSDGSAESARKMQGAQECRDRVPRVEAARAGARPRIVTFNDEAVAAFWDAVFPAAEGTEAGATAVTVGHVIRDASRALRLPLRFGSVAEELSFLALLELLQVGSAYERLVKTHSTQGSLRETVLGGLLGMFISGSSLGAQSLAQMNATAVAEHFRVSCNDTTETLGGGAITVEARGGLADLCDHWAAIMRWVASAVSGSAGGAHSLGGWLLARAQELGDDASAERLHEAIVQLLFTENSVTGDHSEGIFRDMVVSQATTVEDPNTVEPSTPPPICFDRNIWVLLYRSWRRFGAGGETEGNDDGRSGDEDGRRVVDATDAGANLFATIDPWQLPAVPSPAAIDVLFDRGLLLFCPPPSEEAAADSTSSNGPTVDLDECERGGSGESKAEEKAGGHRESLSPVEVASIRALAELAVQALARADRERRGADSCCPMEIAIFLATLGADLSNTAFSSLLPLQCTNF